MDQTLTCTIGDLEQTHPVIVSWEDPDGNAVLETDNTNYSFSQGTVSNDGIQSATLTIKTPKLTNFADQESFAYKCLVTSSLYPESSPVVEHEVMATVLTLGNGLTSLFLFLP